MALGSPTLWLLIAWVAASAALIALGVEARRRKRRGLGALFTASGILVTLAPLWAFFYTFSPLSNPTSMHVEGFDPARDSGFTVAMRHKQDFWTESAVSFYKPGGAPSVAEIFEDQYPDGIVTATTALPDSDGSVSIWHLSSDKSRFDVVTSVSDDWYVLVTQFAVVDPVGGRPGVRIPFPRSDEGGIEFLEGTAYDNGWTNEQWLDFFADVPGASTAGGAITVPTNHDYTATIALTDGVAVVTLNN